jgi:hypothetical protein
MEELELPIKRLNEFLTQHEFRVNDPLGDVAPRDMYAVVKVQITGTKEMYRAGDKMTFITYTTFIQPSSPMMNTLAGLLMRGHNELELDNQNMTFYILNNRISDQLQRFLLYWGVENPVICTKVINETSNNINENLIMEGKLDKLTRILVRDIIRFFKYQREGEFTLPEDIDGGEMVYTYRGIEGFVIKLNLELSDDVETVDADAELRYDDDDIIVTIISNPNAGNSILDELTHELNELIRHELEHVKQHDEGYESPEEEEKDPEKYYTQQQELEAQRAGFKKKSKTIKLDFETVVRNWFKKNPHKHELNPEQQERVIQKILEEI